MTDSTPPRTHQLAEFLRSAWYEAGADAPRDHPFWTELASALLASFDIRPHNEPADARIPEDMTAEKLRWVADRITLPLGTPYPSLQVQLRAWADVLAARDVGGDSPAEETT